MHITQQHAPVAYAESAVPQASLTHASSGRSLLLRSLPNGKPSEMAVAPQHPPVAWLRGAGEARARLTPASASRSLLLRSLLLESGAGRLGPDCACASRQGAALSGR